MKKTALQNTNKVLKNENRRLRKQIKFLQASDSYQLQIKLMQRNIQLEKQYFECREHLHTLNALLNIYKLLVGDCDLSEFYKKGVDET